MNAGYGSTGVIASAGHLLLMLTLLACETSAVAQTRLFDTAEPIRLTIVAPVRDLVREREKKKTYDGVMRFAGATGREIELPIQVAPRGNSRLRVCRFPPLKIKFEKAPARGTVFEGLHNLKLVTHCKSGQRASDWLLQEYGAYLGYNVISDYSFRVRRVETVYLDTESSRFKREETSFFIEPVEEAARRLERVTLRPPNVEQNQLNKVETARSALFQYLIGNTDYAVKRGPRGEGCCHNGRVLAPVGEQSDWIVLPYDFDQAGIVQTDYALPDERLRIRSVKDRLYRGFCWHNAELADAIKRFNERRDEITAALLPPDLSKRRARSAQNYVAMFFRTINDPDDLKKYLLDRCRGTNSLPVRASTFTGAR